MNFDHDNIILYMKISYNFKINISQKFTLFYSRINIIKFNILTFIKTLEYIINYGNFIIISFTRSICCF